MSFTSASRTRSACARFSFTFVNQTWNPSLLTFTHSQPIWSSGFSTFFFPLKYPGRLLMVTRKFFPFVQNFRSTWEMCATVSTCLARISSSSNTILPSKSRSISMNRG